MSGCLLNRNVSIWHLRDPSNGGGCHEAGATDNEHRGTATTADHWTSQAWEDDGCKSRSGAGFERATDVPCLGQIPPVRGSWTPAQTARTKLQPGISKERAHRSAEALPGGLC